MRNTMLIAAVCTCLWLFPTRNADAAEPDSSFKVVMVATSSERWDAMKYNVRTGEAWTPRGGQWVAVIDEEALPRGEYIVHMTALDNNWAALRLDMKTGRTWQCQQGKWAEIPHESTETKETEKAED